MNITRINPWHVRTRLSDLLDNEGKPVDYPKAGVIVSITEHEKYGTDVKDGIIVRVLDKALFEGLLVSMSKDEVFQTVKAPTFPTLNITYDYNDTNVAKMNELVALGANITDVPFEINADETFVRADTKNSRIGLFSSIIKTGTGKPVEADK